MKLNRICFLGTPEFSVPILSMLMQYQNRNQSQISVITMPDKKQGRKQILKPSPVKMYALSLNLPVYTPPKTDLSACIDSINPDLIVVVAYGHIIEKHITDTYFCINIHTSLLPQYRGASPIHTALLNGDLITGVSIIRMNERMDEGDILYSKQCEIQFQDTLHTLTHRLATLSAKACESFINDCYLSNAIKQTKQDHQQATYTQKITPDVLCLDLESTASSIHNQVRAFSPKPGAYVVKNNKRVKIIETTIIENKLHILKVQPEGKAVMAYTAYLQGNEALI